MILSVIINGIALCIVSSSISPFVIDISLGENVAVIIEHFVKLLFIQLIDDILQFVTVNVVSFLTTISLISLLLDIEIILEENSPEILEFEVM